MLANKHALLIIAASLFHLMACGNEPSPATTDAPAMPFEEAILGTWEMIEREVTTPSFEGGDSTAYRLIREADWARVYGVTPPRTTFTPDGKLVRRNRLVGSEEVVITHGLWEMKGDSLMIIEPNIMQYLLPTLGAGNDQLELKGLIDSDNDGETDDSYRVRYRLVGRTIEAEG